MSLKLSPNQPLRLTAALFLGIICVSQLSSTPNNGSVNISSEPTFAGQAGMRIVRDPNTNENLAEGQVEAEDSTERASGTTFRAQVNSSPVERVFEEKPSNKVGGGMVIELNGAFNSHMRVSISPNGQIHSHCNHDHEDDEGEHPVS